MRGQGPRQCTGCWARAPRKADRPHKLRPRSLPVVRVLGTEVQRELGRAPAIPFHEHRALLALLMLLQASL